tara:strand:+ start:3821 stop:5380 length:1560 start_codon:yes stop_codon:yes gene_type:complete
MRSSLEAGIVLGVLLIAGAAAAQTSDESEPSEVRAAGMEAVEVPVDSAETGEVEPAEPEAGDEPPADELPSETAEVHAASPDAARTAAPPLGQVWTRTLPNGLQVVGRRDGRQRTAAVCVSYHVGSEQDPAGYTGLAHLTEHLMFAPTQRMPNGFHGLLEPAGAIYINAFTTDDETRYCSSFPEGALPLALYGEGERMAFLLESLSEESFAIQSRVVRQEDLDRTGGDRGISERIWRLPYEELYPDDHPFWLGRRPQDDVAAIELDHVRWFHQTYYVPANAVVSIVAPQGEDEVVAWVERYLGHVRGGERPTRPEWIQPDPLTEETRIDFELPSRMSRLSMLWPSAPLYAPGDAELDFVALYVKQELAAELRPQRGARYSVRQRSDLRGSHFLVDVTAATPEDLEPIRETIDYIIGKVRFAFLSEADFTGLHGAAMAFIGTSPLERANRLAGSMRHGGPPRTEEQERARYEAVTRESLLGAARRYLPDGVRVLLVTSYSDVAPRRGFAHIRRTPPEVRR